MKRHMPADTAGACPQLTGRPEPGRTSPVVGAEQECPRIPDYELIRPIGGGSYGEVWLARNIIGAFRAVKIVYRRKFGDDRPFEREFSGIQKFEPISRSHESQVAILHVGRKADYFYYVMELADDAGLDPQQGVSERRSGGKSSSSQTAANPLRHRAGVNGPKRIDSVPEHKIVQQGRQAQGLQATSPGHAISSYIPRTLKLELQRRCRLPVPECIEIGIGLTTALGHLHKNGLVHRDVKPSNVIFIKGAPKLADIGLVTDFDATVSCVGTEGFLPPEGPGGPQADLFALGKVLYEISTGKDRKDYPEPPTLLGDFADRQELLELGEIIKRACAANPHERYASAEQLEADLLLLKAGKSVRRTHMLERQVKVVTRTAVALLGVMVLGVVPYCLAIKEARVAAAGERKAKTETAKSQQVASLLKKMLQGVGPEIALGRDTTLLREILDNTAESIGQELTNQPEVEAEVKDVIGQAYAAIGQYQKSEALHREVFATRTNLFGFKHPAVAESLDHLGSVLSSQSRLTEAEALIREGLGLRKELLGSEHPDVAASLNDLALALSSQSNNPQAETAAREAVMIWRKTTDPHYPDDLANGLNTLARVLSRSFKFEEAEGFQREALALYEQLRGKDHVASCLDNLGYILAWRGKLVEAEACYRQALAMQRTDSGDTHPASNSPLNGLVDVLLREDKYADAEQVLREVLTPTVESRPESAGLLQTRAHFFARRGRWQEAADDLARAIDYQPANAALYNGLLPLLATTGNLDLYRTYRSRALTQFASTADPYVAHMITRACLLLPASHSELAVLDHLASNAVNQGKDYVLAHCFRFSKGLAEFRQGHFAEAIDWLRRSLDQNGFVLPAETYSLLAMAQRQLGQVSEGRIALAQAMEFMQTELPQSNGDLGRLWVNWLVAQALLKEAKGMALGIAYAVDDEHVLKDLLTPGDSAPSGNPVLLRARAAFCGRRGLWSQAIADAIKLIEIEPANPTNHQMLGALLVASGDLAGYCQQCRKALVQFRGTRDPAVADLIARDCLMAPCAEVDPRAAGELAETAIAGGMTSEFPWTIAWRQGTKGLSEYRQGHFENAVAWLQKSLGYGSADLHYLQASAVLAMAYCGQKEFSKAQSALTDSLNVAKVRMARSNNSDPRGCWELVDVLVSQALLSEAKATVEGSSDLNRNR